MPPMPPAVLAAPPPRTYYREHYSDTADKNPMMERTAGYLAGYRFTDAGGAGVPTPAALHDQTTLLLGGGTRYRPHGRYTVRTQ